MKILFDTSVLVAGIVQAHPMHPRALPWLQRAKAKEFQFLVVSHTLAELYGTLSGLPLKPRISPGTALHLIHENVETSAKFVALSVSDYISTIKRMADLGLSGGVIYDALIARAAQKLKVQHLLTFNEDDFRRVWPEDDEGIITIP